MGIALLDWMLVNLRQAKLYVLPISLALAPAMFLAPPLPANAQTAAMAQEPVCKGPRSTKLRPKIVGGWRADIKHWPGQVSIRAHNPLTQQSFHFCGASVISPHWVLTAAHCFYGFVQRDTQRRYFISFDNVPSAKKIGFEGPGYLEAVMGTDDLDDIGPENIREIEKIVIHGGYEDAPRTGHDIALVKLDRPWTGPISRISEKADTDPATPPGAATMIAGFGDQEWQAGIRKYARQGGGAFAAGSPAMREVDLPTIPLRQCQKRYEGAAIGAGQICAGYEEGKKDSCQGDSGGPLVAFDREGCPYQIGIVSWGAKCASPKSYGIYTRVSHYIDWIKKYVNEPLVPADARVIAKNMDASYQVPLAKGTIGALKGLFSGAGHRLNVVLARKNGDAPRSSGLEKLKLGDNYVVRLSSSGSGRVILLDMDARGTVTQIFPNKFVRGSKVAALSSGETLTIPGSNYGFDWFEAVEPLGKGRLVAMLVPDDFPLSAHIASKDRLEADLGPVASPSNYVLNLIDQIHGHMAKSSGDQVKPDKVNAGSAKGAWGLKVIDYEIVLR